MRTIRIAAIALAIPLLLAPATLRGQEVAALAARLSAMTAVSGFEQPMADTLLTLLPGSRRDRAGNVIKSYGGGSGGLLVACPMDEVGFVVGEVRPDGWLTLRRVGAPLPDPKFDQRLEGERITVWGKRGPIPGVVAVRSVHLTRGRGAADQPFTVDDALVDVGAGNDQEALVAGAAILSPVAFRKQPVLYGADRLAAPFAGRRSACAALVAGALAAHPSGRVVVAFLVEQQLGGRGLLTVMNVAGPFDETVLADGRGTAVGAPAEVLDSAFGARFPKLGRVTRLNLAVRYPGTPVETVSLFDVKAMAALLAKRIGGGK